MFPKETKYQQEIIDFYGEPGENQVRLYLPYPMKLSWDKSKTIKSFYCHEKVKDSLFEILKSTLAYYGIEEIERLGLDIWGGCFNVRKKRGGDTFSLHSWGIAIDLDPDNNRLKWKSDKAHFAKSEYDMFWTFVEENGWKGLGRSRNFDWMHIQATS